MEIILCIILSLKKRMKPSQVGHNAGFAQANNQYTFILGRLSWETG